MAVCPISLFVAVFSAAKLSSGTEVAFLYEHEGFHPRFGGKTSVPLSLGKAVSSHGTKS